MMDEVSSQSQFSKEELLNDDLSDDSDNDQENEQPQAISSSESINKIEFEKKYFEATDIITQLRMRLIRRTSMIDEIRKCYLRDVVVLKNVLDEILTGTEKEIIVKEITSRLPSLDLRQSLAVHAPKNTEMRVSPCESCGGRVEAILIDSDEVIQLQKLVSQMKERENRFKLKLAELDAKLEKVTKDKAESGKRHMEEKKVLYAEMKKVREDSQVCIDDLGKISQINKKLRKENEDLTMQVAEVAVLNAKIASAEEQIRSLQRSLSDDVNMQYQQKIAEKKYRKEIVALKNELDHLRKIPDSSNTSKFAAYEYSDLMLFISKLESENAALKFAVQSVENEMQQTSTTILELLHQKEDLKIATETASSASEAQQLAFQKSLDRLSELSAAYELIKEENRQLLTGMEQKEKSLQANREFFATNDITTSPSKKHLILSPLNSHRIDNDTSLDDSFVAEASEAVKNHQEKAGSYSSNPPLPSRRRSIPRFFKFGKSTFSGQSIMADDSMPSVGGKIYWHKSHDHRRSGVPSKGSQKLKTPLQSAEQQRLAVKTGDSSHGLNSGKSTIGISNSGSADGSQSDTGLIVKPKVLVASHKTTKKFVPPKDKIIELLPPSDGANDIELWMRDSLIKALSAFPDMSQNAVFRAMNATAHVVAEFSRLLCQSMESAWESMVNERRMLAVILQTNSVLDGIVTCAADDVTIAKLRKVCDQTSPLLDNLPSENWTTPSSEGHIFTDEIMCKLADSKIEETHEWKHATYDTFFFHREETKLQASVEDALILVKRMSNFTRETLREFRDNLQTVFKDWTLAKEVFIDLDNVIVLANEKVRREMEIKLSKMGEDLRRMSSMYENNYGQLQELQNTLKGLLQIESELHRCEEKLFKSEYQKDVYQEQVRELTMTITELRNKLRKMEVELNDAKAQANILEFNLSEANLTKKESQDKVLQLTRKITELSESILSWKGAYDDLLAKEADRRSQMKSVNLQCQPSSSSMAIQTEFLTQPIGLRTIVADNLNKLGVARYPLPMVISQPQLTNTNTTNNTTNTSSSSSNTHTNHSAISTFTSTTPEARGYSRGGLRPSETAYHLNNNSSHTTNTNSLSNSISNNGMLSARSYSSLNSAVSSLSNVSFFQMGSGQDGFALGLSFPTTTSSNNQTNSNHNNSTHFMEAEAGAEGGGEEEESDSLEISFEHQSQRDRALSRSGERKSTKSGSSQYVHLKGARAHRANAASNSTNNNNTPSSNFAYNNNSSSSISSGGMNLVLAHSADSVSLPRMGPSLLATNRSTPSATGRRSDAGNATNNTNNTTNNNAFAPTTVRLRTAEKSHRGHLLPNTTTTTTFSSSTSFNTNADLGIGYLDGSSVNSSARSRHRSRSPKPIALSIAALRRAQEDMVPLLYTHEGN